MNGQPAGPYDAIRETLRANRDELLARVGFSEDDTIKLLIVPFLEHLGHAAAHRRSEHEANRQRPDEIIYDGPVSLYGNRPSRIILEAKPLHAPFDRGSSRTDTPARQIRRYLQNHPTSGPDTYGVLTDGVRYRISRRTGHLNDVKHVGEWNILEQPGAIAEIAALLGHGNIPAAEARLPAHSAARALTEAIAGGGSPNRILDLLTRDRDLKPAISAELALTGRALDAAQNDWESHAWRHAAGIRTEQPDLEGSRVATAVIRYATPEPGSPAHLARGDVALAARTFARATPCRAAALIVCQANADGVIDRARAAVHYQGHTGMTPEFDPHNPPPSTLRSLERIRDSLRQPQIAPERLTGAVTAQVIRKEFYEAIAGWTRAQQAGRNREERQWVLRHLIRTVFAWILKEDGLIPDEPFEERFAAQHGGGDYHGGILTFLFRYLNTPETQRAAHPARAVQEALADTPFLNGSLFADHPGDDAFTLDDSDYFGAAPERPGLFTIMARYNWTTTEHTPGESDQTIDPEMLSNLFENLIAATEFWEENPDRMPAGTYYTPADVATEMVKDALAAAVRRHAPPRITEAQLRDLFSDPEAELPRLNPAETARLREAIARLALFDPSVGSGEFPLIAANALRIALAGLGDTGADLTRRIIQGQLYAQDINPMATQITRLRLFIAIMAAERDLPETRPLPNLEGRIVCADTLATIARPQWRPERTGGLADADPEIRAALTGLAGVRRQWLDAHTETDKAAVRAADAAARQRLRATLERTGNADHPEISGFARYQLLEPGAAAADTDARLLFYAPDWSGFDVVIGNPPYETIAKGQPAAARNAAKRRLRDNKQYQTTNGGDLYNLFCEVALTLAKPEDGVVTLVVPLSLAFGQDQVATRQLFQQRAKSIRLRHQDNRPDKTFHASPVEHPENRQRTTIVTAVTGEPRAIIETTGTGKWAKSEREQYLLNRSYTQIPATLSGLHTNLANQWPRIPSEAISRLIAEMRAQRRTIANLSNPGVNPQAIALPQTAYEFITAAPARMLQRREMLLVIAGVPELQLAMAILNGHAAYAWWRVWGDAFDLNDYEFTSFPIPDLWLDDAETNAQARGLGRELIEAITPDNIVVNRSGTLGNTFENINFYRACPETVRRLDELYLTALGLPPEPLLRQLRALRSGSNWRV